MDKDYDCPYQMEESTKDFLIARNCKPCELPCPLNKNQKCYRWDICFTAKKLRKE